MQSAPIVGVIPVGVFARLEKLNRAGYTALVENADELTPGEIARYRCAACDHNHPALVVVDITYDTTRWTLPAQNLTRVSTRCCWRGLCRYLDEVSADEQFAGVTIGVPVGAPA